MAVLPRLHQHWISCEYSSTWPSSTSSRSAWNRWRSSSSVQSASAWSRSPARCRAATFSVPNVWRASSPAAMVSARSAELLPRGATALPTQPCGTLLPCTDGCMKSRSRISIWTFCHKVAWPACVRAAVIQISCLCLTDVGTIQFRAMSLPKPVRMDVEPISEGDSQSSNVSEDMVAPARGRRRKRSPSPAPAAAAAGEGRASRSRQPKVKQEPQEPARKRARFEEEEVGLPCVHRSVALTAAVSSVGQGFGGVRFPFSFRA